jgi:hypothetical protein
MQNRNREQTEARVLDLLFQKSADKKGGGVFLGKMDGGLIGCPDWSHWTMNLGAPRGSDPGDGAPFTYHSISFIQGVPFQSESSLHVTGRSVKRGPPNNYKATGATGSYLIGAKRPPF